MTGFNHGLTGGLIAAYMPLPVALPLAFASHFMLDALPHYGISHDKRDHSKFWKYFFIADFIATFCLAAYAIIDNHYAMFLGGLVAIIPDFLWVSRVLRTRSFDLSTHSTKFSKWHAGIQRLERPWGIWIEIPLAAVLFCLVMIMSW